MKGAYLAVVAEERRQILLRDLLPRLDPRLPSKATNSRAVDRLGDAIQILGRHIEGLQHSRAGVSLVTWTAHRLPPDAAFRPCARRAVKPLPVCEIGCILPAKERTW
jgi:hypothetical protein